MQLLVTGSNGLLGRAVVREALERGHRVRALVRAASEGPAFDPHPRLEVARGELRDGAGLTEALQGVEAVVHLAARKTGPLAEQTADTVEGTRHLLDAMADHGLGRLVLSSTFSVYDYYRMPAWRWLDETAPEQAQPHRRDAYAQTKLQQERLVRDWAAAEGRAVTLLRLGVVYGRGHLWTPWLGVTLGARWWLRLGSRAPIPLTYVENAAEVLVRAAETDAACGRVLNVLDDDPPSQATYSRLIQPCFQPPPRIIPVPRRVAATAAHIASAINRHLLRDRLRLPSVLIPERLAARSKPMRYDNTRLKETLDWTPHYPLPEAIDRSMRAADRDIATSLAAFPFDQPQSTA
jgi:nucleoside-diphosphate-sugar epimerase